MAGGEPAKRVRSAQAADERLLIEAAQADVSRFGEVYERFFEVVYAYVARRMRDRSTVEDVVSEVFRRALANLSRYKSKGAPFAAWLFRIAANLIADRARREAKFSALEDDANLISQDLAKDSQSSLEDVERRAQLFRLVDGLPEDQRRVVTMRFAEEKSIKQIAENLQRSEGAVKQLQFRALQSLRQKITTEDTENANREIR